jgi:hypothetical protein
MVSEESFDLVVLALAVEVVQAAAPFDHEVSAHERGQPLKIARVPGLLAGHEQLRGALADRVGGEVGVGAQRRSAPSAYMAPARVPTKMRPFQTAGVASMQPPSSTRQSSRGLRGRSLRS